MLASVTDAAESEMALAAGADIIDLKDPAKGALGALPPQRIAAIVSKVAGRRPVSATLGDLPADAALLRRAMQGTAATGVDYIKLGVFSRAHIDACLQAAAGLQAGSALIAVLFADRDPPLHDLSRFASAGFSGVMLDTADKQSGGLLHNMQPQALRLFVERARNEGLLCGLAGSLKLNDIATLLELAPDYLGFRGALCQGQQRQQQLDPKRLAEVRGAIPLPPGLRSARC